MLINYRSFNSNLNLSKLFEANIPVASETLELKEEDEEPSRRSFRSPNIMLKSSLISIKHFRSDVATHVACWTSSDKRAFSPKKLPTPQTSNRLVT
jgi:hypothetical protein